jgi:hypothetical protein
VPAVDMVHRGPLPIRRMLTLKPVEGAAQQTEGKGIPVTGDSYFDLEVEALLRWKKWHKDSLAFLSSAGESIRLGQLVVEYRTVIENFHNQVGRDIAEFHKDDVEFMLAMRAALEEKKRRVRMHGQECPAVSAQRAPISRVQT